METHYYITHKIDSELVVSDNLSLKPGYYRYNFTLSGSKPIPTCEYSDDGYMWVVQSGFDSLSDFQEAFSSVENKLMTFEKMEYVETITYRDYAVPIFLDDYGQCFYCIIRGRIVSFGSYQSTYEDDVKYLIERELKAG